MSEPARRSNERRGAFRSAVIEIVPVIVNGPAPPLAGRLGKISPTGANVLLDAAPAEGDTGLCFAIFAPIRLA